VSKVHLVLVVVEQLLVLMGKSLITIVELPLVHQVSTMMM
jgi:hypothetical protein